MKDKPISQLLSITQSTVCKLSYMLYVYPLKPTSFPTSSLVLICSASFLSRKIARTKNCCGWMTPSPSGSRQSHYGWALIPLEPGIRASPTDSLKKPVSVKVGDRFTNRALGNKMPVLPIAEKVKRGDKQFFCI